MSTRQAGRLPTAVLVATAAAVIAAASLWWVGAAPDLSVRRPAPAAPGWTLPSDTLVLRTGDGTIIGFDTGYSTIFHLPPQPATAPLLGGRTACRIGGPPDVGVRMRRAAGPAGTSPTAGRLARCRRPTRD